MASIKPVAKKSKFGTTHLNMIQAVVTFVFAAGYVVITESIAAFNTLMLAVQTNLASIEALRQSISNPITGPAAQKKALKAQLAQATAAVMKAAFTYAQDTDNADLAAQMKTSVSDLMRLKYVDLFTRVSSVVTTLTPIVSDLAPYNVLPGALTSITTTATTLSTIIASPKNQIAIRKAINEQIQSLLRDTMLMLYNECDELAFQFKAANLTYYNIYMANRKLNPTHMSTQLRLYVINQIHQPVTTGEVFILGTDRSAALDVNGYALVDHIPFGTHSFSLTTPAGTNTYGPYDFKKGKSLTFHIQVSDSSSAPVVKVTSEDIIETAEIK